MIARILSGPEDRIYGLFTAPKFGVACVEDMRGTA